MSLYAWPLYADKKFRGANLCGRTTDSYTGDFGSYGNLYDIWYDWPWTTHLKPQIDAVHSLGGNLIRLISDATLRVGDSGHSSFATWRGTITAQNLADRLDQLITYLDSLGMYFYATGIEAWAASNSGLGITPLMDYLSEYVALVTATKYTNVVGIDLVQEFPGNSVFVNNLSTVFTTGKAARTRLLPVTCSIWSFSANDSVTGCDWTTRGSYQSVHDAGGDYFDNHFYMHLPTPAELQPLHTNPWDFPVVVGEMGIDYNGNFSTGAADGTSAGKRQVWYEGMAQISDLGWFQAMTSWAAVQMSNFDGNDYGLFGKTQDGSNIFTDPRTEMTIPFQTIRKDAGRVSMRSV